MTKREKEIINKIVQELLKGMFWILFLLLLAAFGLAWLLVTNLQNL